MIRCQGRHGAQDPHAWSWVGCVCSRILQWRDRTAQDDFAVNADEPEYYRRTAM